VASPLNPVERALKRIFSELGDAGVPCALIGGLAVSARAEPRTTRDVDVAISADGDDAAEQLVFHLQSRGYVMGTLLEQDRAQLLTAQHGLKVDSAETQVLGAARGTFGRGAA